MAIQKCKMMWRKGNSQVLLKRMKIGTTTGENSMQVLQKIKSKPLYDPAIPLLGIYPKKIKILTQKDICTPMFTAALLTIARYGKTLRVHQQMNS